MTLTHDTIRRGQRVRVINVFSRHGRLQPYRAYTADVERVEHHEEGARLTLRTHAVQADGQGGRARGWAHVWMRAPGHEFRNGTVQVEVL